jgi:hypothetical protein
MLIRCILAHRAAAAMLKGLTAQYLLHSTYAVKPGNTILVRELNVTVLNGGEAYT